MRSGCITQVLLNTVLCDNLEGRRGQASEGRDICIPVADSCHFMAEANTILSNYPPIKKIKGVYAANSNKCYGGIILFMTQPWHVKFVNIPPRDQHLAQNKVHKPNTLLLYLSLSQPLNASSLKQMNNPFCCGRRKTVLSFHPHCFQLSSSLLPTTPTPISFRIVILVFQGQINAEKLLFTSQPSLLSLFLCQWPLCPPAVSVTMGCSEGEGPVVFQPREGICQWSSGMSKGWPRFAAPEGKLAHRKYPV